MFARSVICCLTLAIAWPAQADALSDKLCPILENVASELSGKVPAAVQAELVLSIADAYQYDDEALRNVTDNIDAAAGANCPAARDALMQRLEMGSLQQALR